MKEKLKILLQTLADFDEKQLDKVADCFHSKFVKRNALLLREGETCKAFYYIHTGCIRTYFTDRNGQEKTRYVMPGCTIGTALTSFISQKPSMEFIDALEDTQLLFISHSDFYHLNKEVESWKSFYQRILEMAYTFQNRKIEQLITQTAKQRYDNVLKVNPALIQQLSNKVLASYLDMREETLSRLKSK